LYSPQFLRRIPAINIDGNVGDDRHGKTLLLLAVYRRRFI